MSRAGAHTHSQLFAKNIIGNPGDFRMDTFTLPAGGPWIIHTVYGQIIKGSNVDTDVITGHFFFQPTAGDFNPNPVPSEFPFDTSGWWTGTNTLVPQSTLSLFPVHWQAPGKSQLDVFTHIETTSVGAASAVVGIIYAPALPQQTFPTKYAHIFRDLDSTSEVQLGTIQLAQSARRLLGVHGHLSQKAEILDNDIAFGSFRLDSADLQISPATFPFQTIYGPAPGTNVLPIQIGAPFFIPLDIPVPEGARIDVFSTWPAHFNREQDQLVFLAYE